MDSLKNWIVGMGVKGGVEGGGRDLFFSEVWRSPDSSTHPIVIYDRQD
jgi:hypothetical protein